MIARMFRKLVLDFKRNSSAFNKYYHSVNGQFSNTPYRNVNTDLFSENKVFIGYFLNEQNTLKERKISPHQLMHMPMLNGPLCCRNNILAGTNSVNHYPITGNSIRHSSNSVTSFLNQAIVYNNGICKTISESAFVELCMDALRMLHCSTGLPWWATIMAATFLIRTFVNLPIAVHQHQITAKLENVGHEMKEVAKRLQTETKMEVLTSNLDPSVANRMYRNAVRQEWRESIVRENCHPLKVPVMVILQMPIWISFAFSLRNICYRMNIRDELTYQTYLEFTNGGFGWMVDLTQMDHSFILPIIFGISNLATIELMKMLYKGNETKFRRIYTHFIRIVIICLVPVMAYIPSCLTLLWTSNVLYHLFEILLLLSPKIRRLGGIPKTDSELQHPYAELYKRMKERFHLQNTVTKQ